MGKFVPQLEQLLCTTPELTHMLKLAKQTKKNIKMIIMMVFYMPQMLRGGIENIF